MENFTPVSALIGGVLIGAAATFMLWANGRIAGISGILGGILFPVKSEIVWRILFIAGLLSASLAYMFFSGASLDISVQTTPLLTAVAGLLVGFGTRMGSGCTSGHGICGIARISKRSFLATVVFIGAGVVSVFLLRHILGLGL
ncbi:MAG: YeeE/YedE family protein [Pseudohongiella sp.]|nr:YeeE/YedE family protein [Pseudohongiella sp.]